MRNQTNLTALLTDEFKSTLRPSRVQNGGVWDGCEKCGKQTKLVITVCDRLAAWCDCN